MLFILHIECSYLYQVILKKKRNFEEFFCFLFKIILLNHHQYCIKEVFTGKLGVNICDYCNRT